MTDEPPGGRPPFSNPDAKIIPLRPDKTPKPMDATSSNTTHEQPSKPKCGAKNRTGGTCGKPSGWGTNHVGIGKCRFHGGNTPNGKKSAERQRAEADIKAAEAKARRAVAELSEVNTAPALIENPLTALAELAGDAVRWKNVVAAYVADLRKFRYQAQGMDAEGNETSGGEQIRGEVVVFERALARCESILVAMARLNLDERMVRIDEKIAERMFGAFEAGLDVLKLDPVDRQRAERVMGSEVRKLVS